MVEYEDFVQVAGLFQLTPAIQLHYNILSIKIIPHWSPLYMQSVDWLSDAAVC